MLKTIGVKVKQPPSNPFSSLKISDKNKDEAHKEFPLRLLFKPDPLDSIWFLVPAREGKRLNEVGKHLSITKGILSECW